MASSDADEVYQRESKAFLTKLFNFHERRGTPIKRIPLLGGRELDLYHLYKKVSSLGGSEVVTRCRLWGEVARSFNLPPSVTSASYAIRQHFTKLLESYEAVERGYALPPVPQPQPILLPPTIYRPPVLPQPPPPTTHHFPSLTVAQKQKDDEKTVKCDRIMRSLMSGLPNEVDFALNVLTIMSHSAPRDLPIEKMPHLLNVMLAHVAIFSDDDWGLEAVYHESWYRDSELNFLEFWELAVPEWVYGSVLSSTFTKASFHSSLFTSRSPLVEGEGVEGYRVSQVLTILQNLSFEENSQQFLAQHTGVRRLLLLCSNSHLLSIRSCALDTLSNLASALLLSHEPFSTTDLLLATVHQCILSEDKLCIIRGLEVLGELAWCLHNEPSLNCTPTEVYHRIFCMLILPDCELVIASLEALYNLSFYGADIAESIVQVNNSIEVLVHLLTLKVESFGEEVLERTMLVVPNPQLSQLSTILTNQIQARTNLSSGITSSTTNQNSASSNTPVIVLPGGVQVSNVGMATGLKTASLQQLTNQIQPKTSGSRPLTISSLPLKLNQNLLTQKNSFSTVLTGKQVQDLIAQLRPPAPTPSPSTHTPSTTTLSTRGTNINLTVPTPPLRVQSSSLAVPGGVSALGLPKAGMQGDEFAQRWLRMCYEEAPSNYVPRVEMYTLYILYCSEMGQTNIVNSNDFNNIIRRVFPNSLFTRVTVNHHTVHMIAGLRKHKTSPQASEPNNTPAPIKLVSIPGTSTLVATVGKGVTSGSAPKLNTPASLQLPSNKMNFGVHSPLAIANKASGVLHLNSALSRPLAPATVTLTNQIAPLGHMTTTTLTNLKSNESRSSSPNPSSNMTTTSTLQLVSTVPLSATPLLPTLANTSATQGSITGCSSPITAQTSTRPSSPASSTLSLSSVCPISRASSPAVQPQGANSRPSTPALSVSSIGESENSTLSRSLSGPGINPQVVPTVGSVTLAGLSNSRSRSTSPASVVSSDGMLKTQGLRCEDVGLHREDVGLHHEDAGQLSSGVPIRLIDGHVSINYGMASQDGGRLVSEAHVGENEKLLEPEPKRNKLDTTLDDNDKKIQAVNAERIPLGVQSDLTHRTDTVSQSGMAVESTGTLSLTTPAVTMAATADVHTTTTFTTKRSDNICTTASSSQTSKTGFGVSDQHVVTHPQTSTVLSNNASQVAVTGRLNITTTRPTLPTPHLPTTNATPTSSTSILPSSGHLNTNLPPHHSSSSTTNAAATSSTLHTHHDPSTAKLNTTTVPATLHTHHDSSSTAAKLNATTTLSTFHNLHDSSLVMASKPLSVCTNGSQTNVKATVMAVNCTSQLVTPSSTCSGTSADSDKNMPRPLSSRSGETPCVCSWDNCTRSHSSWENLFYHVVYDHLSAVTTFPCACRWQACPSQVKRMRPSMLRHIQTHHCSAGPRPSPPSVPTTLAKLKALPELEHERESLLTKAVRLTAGLVLRNLIRTVPEARRRLVRWELHLCQIALSTSEASTAISQCLYLLHHPPPTSTDTDNTDSEMPYHASNLL